MINRVASLFILASLVTKHVIAVVAPEITTVTDGYHFIVKLPCIGCPYLYPDPSKNQNEPWIQKKEENALLLNITLPFSSTHLTINTANLLIPSPNPPQIHANQVPLSTSKLSISSMLENNSLDTPGSASFALSYAYSLHPIKSSPNGLLFHLDIRQLWSPLTSPPVTVALDDARQKTLQILLLQRPSLSALDASPAYEIIRTELVSRTASPATMRTVWIRGGYGNGEKGSWSRFFRRVWGALATYMSSGLWAAIVFVAALMGLFVVLGLFCCFAVGALSGEEYNYERAQLRKRKRKAGWNVAADDGGRGKGGGDLEKGREVARLVGVGKSD